MNKVALMGRLAREPEVKYSQNNESMAVVKFALAVDRRKSKENKADFIDCVAFGKTGEFTSKYFKKGSKIAITGRIQSGSYTNKDGKKVYTTYVVVEEQFFCERKEKEDKSNQKNQSDNEAYVVEEASYDDFDDLPF